MHGCGVCRGSRYLSTPLFDRLVDRQAKISQRSLLVGDA
jgi:hypothetical protein